MNAINEKEQTTRKGTLYKQAIRVGASGCLSGCITLGIFIVLCFGMLISVSVMLLFDSASSISSFWGFLVIACFLVYSVLSGFLFYPQTDGKKDPIKIYLNFQVLIAVMGFAQVIFWVMNPEDSRHEPRSVFFGVVSAFLIYLRQRYEEFLENTKKEKATQLTLPSDG